VWGENGTKHVCIFLFSFGEMREKWQERRGRKGGHESNLFLERVRVRD